MNYKAFLVEFGKLIKGLDYPLRAFDVTTKNGIKVKNIKIRPFILDKKVSEPYQIFTLFGNDWIIKAQAFVKECTSESQVQAKVDEFVYGVRQVKAPTPKLEKAKVKAKKFTQEQLAYLAEVGIEVE